MDPSLCTNMLEFEGLPTGWQGNISVHILHYTRIPGSSGPWNTKSLRQDIFSKQTATSGFLWGEEDEEY